MADQTAGLPDEMPTSREEFARSLVASGLLTADEVAAFWKSLPAGSRPTSGDAFAQSLVSGGKLTEFQAVELLEGQGTPLVLGPYVVVGSIGAGGMGRVYKAQHKKMKRVVALKVLSPETTRNEASLKRFQREVESAARLSHPNIVQAHDAGEERGVNYLVMEFVDGPDLSTVLKQRGPLPAAEVVDYILQAAWGLAYAHGEGMVHRDIKPANLLLDKRGTVKILDLGLARFELDAGVGEELTNSGQVMGTVDYMAPEQALDTKHADARADIYSLGCTLYRLITGKLLYDGDTLMKKLLAHREAPIPSLAASGRREPPGNFDEQLDAIFQQMVAKRPEDRYQSMHAVVAALESLKSQESGVSDQEPGSRLAPAHPSADFDAPLTNFLAGLGSRTTNTGGRSAATTPATSPKAISGLEETIDTVQPAEDTNERLASFLGAPAGAVATPSGSKPSLRHPSPAKPHTPTQSALRRPAVFYGSIGAGVLTVAGIGVLLLWALGGSQKTAERPSNGKQQSVKLTTQDSAGGLTKGMGASTKANPLSPPARIEPVQPAGWLGRTAFPGGWADLLPALDLAGADKYVNREAQAIVVNVTGAPAQISAAVTIYAKDYDVALDVQAVSANSGFYVYLPHATGMLQVNLGYAGKCTLVGREAEQVPLLLAKNQRHRFDIRIRQVTPGPRVSVLIDGQMLYSWSGDFTQLPPAPQVTTFGQPVLDVNVGSAVRFHYVALVVHDGEARLSRSVPIPAATERQMAEAARQARPLRVTNSVSMTFNHIPPGTFRMGSPDLEPGREPLVEAQRVVVIQSSFYLGAFEVTREQYQQVMGALPAAIQPDDGPPNRAVTFVSSADANAFCRQLSELPAERASGRSYRLATSEEWEYACRAGTPTAYYHGNDSARLTDYAWIQENGQNQPHSVGQKLPNAWCLYDMLGNVWEWCAPLADGGVPHRGGSANNTAQQVRCAAVAIGDGNIRSGALGFRVVCVVASATSTSAADDSGIPGQATSEPVVDVALNLDGDGARAELPAVIGEAGAFTVEVWANLRDISNSRDLVRTSLPDAGEAWTLSFYGQSSAYFGILQGSNWTIAQGQKPPITKWLHLAGVYDGREIRIYQDGRLTGRAAVIAPLKNSSRSYWVGDCGTQAAEFRGRLNELRITKGALYTQDFQPRRRLEVSADTLALYHCDEGNGETLRDASGNKQDGTIVGAKWVSAATGKPLADAPSVTPP